MKEMKTYCHRKPGQKGTRRLLAKYGTSLLCVRYRYDESRGVRMKTVELVVEETPVKGRRHKDDEIVAVTVAFEETGYRQMLRQARAKWDSVGRVWMVRYGLIRGTDLEQRISSEAGSGGKLPV